MTTSHTGALVGLLAGLGLVLVSSWLLARRPLTLAARIASFVGPAGAGSIIRRPPATALAVALLRPADRGLDQSESRLLAARLDAAGDPSTPAQFRLERLGWTGVGAAAGALVGAVLAARGSSPIGVLALGTVGAVAGWWGRDAALGRRVRRRRLAIARHLPILADLAALAVASGAPPLTALEAAASCMSGPLADEVARTVADVRGGLSTDRALRAMAVRTAMPSVQRFVDGLLVALERGTPLVDLMRAQADDVRAAEGRRLMVLAGRKDVAMLVPIVFLVLPSVVLIAIYPGLHSLRFVVP